MIIIAAISLIMFLIIGMVIFFLFFHTKIQQNLWMKQEIEALRNDFKSSLGGLVTQVNEHLKNNTSAIGERLDNTTKIFGSVSEHLGKLHEASTKIFEIGKDINSLGDLLRAPKMRGGLGEFLLADLLSQVIPSKFYQTQYAFRNGQQVDAVIKFGENRLVSIDSKFPLENFRAIISAKTDEERKQSRKQFMNDVKKHISDIASKYIVPDEGTFDFALMYIPAENVYYETIIKDEKFTEDSGLFQYSLNKKVIPVSPNSFYAYLQVILLGLKGMAIEKGTQQILSNLDKLRGDVDRFGEEFGKLGKHLTNSRGSFEDSEKRFQKIHDKIKELGGLKQDRITNDQKIGI